MTFLYGFLTASAIWIALGAIYYARARRRVKSIIAFSEAAAKRHRDAARVVGQACDEL